MIDRSPIDRSPSLDKLQEIVRRRRREGETAPGPDIVVDKEGNIIVVEVERSYSLGTRVPKEVFAVDYGRLIREQSFVRSSMPSNTYRVDENGIEGWMYEINTGYPYYDNYTMFIYYSDGFYYVKLVEPDYAGRYSAHAAHLFSDGTLCLSSYTHGGYPDMGKAYSKSVLWAKFFSEFLRTGEFPEID